MRRKLTTTQSRIPLFGSWIPYFRLHTTYLLWFLTFDSGLSSQLPLSKIILIEGKCVIQFQVTTLYV